MKKKDVYEKSMGNVKPYQGTIYLICCVGVEYDYDIVSHSIKYYKELGVDEFLFVLNTEDENSEKLIEVQNILKEHGIKEKEVWIGEFEDHTKKDNMERVVYKNTNLEDWVVTIDVDEFHKYYVDLRKFIGYCEKMDYICATGELVDRLTETGEITDINENSDIWKTFPVKTNIRYWNATTYFKVLIRKANVDVSTGHHMAININPARICRINMEVHHFKWRGDVLQKHKDRARIFGKRRDLDWDAAQRIIDRYRKNGNFY